MVTKIIRLGSINIRFAEEGQGFPLVLLHGWGGSLNSFDKLQALLNKDYKLFILDLPGFGESDPPRIAWDVDKYADLVRDFIKSQNLHEYVLVGHSFGGRISIKLAMAKTEGLKKVILCASAGIRPQLNLRQKILRKGALLGKRLFKLPVLKMGNKFARKVLYKLIGSQDYLKCSEVLKNTFQKVVTEDLEPLLDRIKLPVLLLWGEDDKITPLADGYLMNQKIPDSKLVIIAGARHGINFQNPRIVAQEIKKFLLK